MHTSIILFYKYFGSNVIHGLRDREEDVQTILDFIKHTCQELGLRGRILFASEGINGTLSGDSDILGCFIKKVEGFQYNGENLFSSIDWKCSKVESHSGSFPDLYISIVKEVVNSGNTVDATNLDEYGGKHLTPEEFHNIIAEGNNNSKEIVLIDVRNTYEYAIGHFEAPSGVKAINPSMITFSTFDSTFCAKNEDYLKDKKVLTYCTGGIRCEKASVMLRKRGIDDVSQLRGGIHRYLEAFPDGGFFKGKIFVFDKRVAATNRSNYDVVGECMPCGKKFDELSGSKLCTVCRTLVLVCNECEQTLREYHCEKHSYLKNCYFTFLEVFRETDLMRHLNDLHKLDRCEPATNSKNVRKTLRKQIEQVQKQLVVIQSGDFVPDPNSPRKCRMCMQTRENCDGNCWGYWK